MSGRSPPALQDGSTWGAKEGGTAWQALWVSPYRLFGFQLKGDRNGQVGT